MKKIIQKLSQAFYNQFKLFWVLMTFLFLFLALISNWALNTSQSTKDLEALARVTANRVDGFIEDLFQEVYTLPLFGNHPLDCKADLLPQLQHITFNHTKISGIIVTNKDRASNNFRFLREAGHPLGLFGSDARNGSYYWSDPKQHQWLCSDLPDYKLMRSKTRYNRALSGPMTIADFDQPVYLFQQKMGYYHVGILVLSSLLQTILQTSDPLTDQIAIDNTVDKKNILWITKNKNQARWSYSNEPDSQTASTSKSPVAIQALQSITGISVAVYAAHESFLITLWTSEIILSILLLLLSFLLYKLVSYAMIHHYSLLNVMKIAIKNKAFYPVYQPIYDTLHGDYAGAEVLLRWKNDNDQLITPEFFIDEAEASGLIVPITLQIVDIALKEYQTILKEHPHFHLGFNLSAFHFTDPNFFESFRQLAQAYQVSADQILFEITERDLLNKNNTIFLKTMQDLRQEGYALAVDDYGTGHASISYLQHFPFNYLKIDKLFVQAIGTKAITESLNDAIIHMAKQLNLIIIAEGVETEEQANYLAANGVRYLQGWYFSKALSAKQLSALLQEKQNDF